MNKIKLNGEFTKEELQEKLKRFDEPEYRLFNDGDGYIYLIKKYEGKEYAKIVAYEDRGDSYFHMGTLIRDMASINNDEMSVVDAFDTSVYGYDVQFDHDFGWGYTEINDAPNRKKVRTEGTAQIICELLDGYEGTIFGVYMGKGE